MNPSWTISLAAVVPALLLAWASHLLLRARRSVAWPVVPATIVESRVVRQGNSRGPRFAFDYTVAAQRHVGHRLWVGPTSISVTGNWAERVASRYPVGATIRVAVDPADPTYAVLEPGLQAMHWLLLVFGAGIMGSVLVAAVAR